MGLWHNGGDNPIKLKGGLQTDICYKDNIIKNW